MLTKLKLNDKEKKMLAVFLPILLIGLFAGALVPGRFSVAASESLDHRLFFLGGKPGIDQIKRGDHLVFSHDLAMGDKKHLVTKIVGCAPGDTLVVDSRGYHCNGEFLGKALEKTSHGEPLPRFTYSGPIPGGSFFMVGQHERSYDSRYFGFIEVDDVVNKAYPIW